MMIMGDALRPALSCFARRQCSLSPPYGFRSLSQENHIEYCQHIASSVLVQRSRVSGERLQSCEVI